MLYPSPKVIECHFATYNTTLSIHQLLENSDEEFDIAHESLYNFFMNIALNQKQPSYVDLSWMVSLVMGGNIGLTEDDIFKGKQASELRFVPRVALVDLESDTWSFIKSASKVIDVVIESYNATLNIDQLLENSDDTVVIDNEALFNISHNILKQKQPPYE